jgi:hypothetical protein
MAKHLLNNTFESYDFSVIGISTRMNLYETLAHINRALNIDLAYTVNLPFPLSHGHEFQFAVFEYENNTMEMEFQFISNTSNLLPASKIQSTGDGLFSGIAVDETARLVKELPDVDFFMTLKGKAHEHRAISAASIIDDLDGITNAEILDLQSLPSKQNLLM